ncbi:hypothetical protein V8E53_011785 [Lactarius tabidus]
MSCCKYLTRLTTHQPLPDILHSLRHIRSLAWCESLAMRYCMYLGPQTLPQSLPGRTKPLQSSALWFLSPSYSSNSSNGFKTFEILRSFTYLSYFRAYNTSRIQPPTSEAGQPTKAQEADGPAGGNASSRWHCVYDDCEATFGRHQELKRHLIGVHTPWRRCPFCSYEWSRPNKIKTHLMENHQDKPQFLNEIHPKNGQHLVEFLMPLCDTSV